MKTWRRLQQLGSVAIKNSVYVLPHTPQAREDFEWLKGEILAAKGRASIMVAEALTDEEEEAIRDAFREARAVDYQALRTSIAHVLRTTKGRPNGPARHAAERALWNSRDELARLDALDFCATDSRAAAVLAVDTLADRLSSPDTRRAPMRATTASLKPKAYRRRTWVTRPRPAVDRMASAWLIQHFIDANARFAFADVPASGVSKRQIPFDMFGAEFGHQGDRCTFETLCQRFAVEDPAVRRVAGIVHDIDLKDQRYGAAEAPVVARLVEGLRESYTDDRELLQHGIALFAGLYASFRKVPATARGASRSNGRAAPPRPQGR